MAGLTQGNIAPGPSERKPASKQQVAQVDGLTSPEAEPSFEETICEKVMVKDVWREMENLWRGGDYG